MGRHRFAGGNKTDEKKILSAEDLEKVSGGLAETESMIKTAKKTLAEDALADDPNGAGGDGYDEMFNSTTVLTNTPNLP